MPTLNERDNVAALAEEAPRNTGAFGGHVESADRANGDDHGGTVGATRRGHAAERRIDAARDDTADDLAQRREESRGAEIDRTRVDRGRTIDLSDPAVTEKRDAITDQHRLLGVMRDDDGGGVGLAQHGEGFGAHGLAQAGI